MQRADALCYSVIEGTITDGLSEPGRNLLPSGRGRMVNEFAHRAKELSDIPDEVLPEDEANEEGGQP
jgi:hypothetical protein